MNEQTRSPEIKFDEWTATPLGVRRLLLDLRAIAACADKSLAEFKSNKRKEQEQAPKFRAGVRQMIGSLSVTSDVARSWLETDLPSSVHETLLALSKLAAAAGPLIHLLIIHLLKSSDQNQASADSFHSSARDFISSVRETANAVVPLYTLLARLDNDVEQAAEQSVGLRNELIRRLRDWGDPFSEDRADEALSRAIHRIEEGEDIQNLLHYCSAVAWNVRREYLKNLPDELPLEIPAPVSDPEIEEARERRFACMRECLAKQPLETRWLISEYSSPDRKGREKFFHREKLAERLGASLPQLRKRIHEVRKELDKCLDGCLKK